MMSDTLLECRCSPRRRELAGNHHPRVGIDKAAATSLGCRGMVSVRPPLPVTRNVRASKSTSSPRILAISWTRNPARAANKIPECVAAVGDPGGFSAGCRDVSSARPGMKLPANAGGGKTVGWGRPDTRNIEGPGSQLPGLSTTYFDPGVRSRGRCQRRITCLRSARDLLHVDGSGRADCAS